MLYSDGLVQRHPMQLTAADIQYRWTDLRVRAGSWCTLAFWGNQNKQNITL